MRQIHALKPFLHIRSLALFDVALHLLVVLVIVFALVLVRELAVSPGAQGVAIEPVAGVADQDVLLDAGLAHDHHRINAAHLHITARHALGATPTLLRKSLVQSAPKGIHAHSTIV